MAAKHYCMVYETPCFPWGEFTGNLHKLGIATVIVNYYAVVFLVRQGPFGHRQRKICVELVVLFIAETDTDKTDLVFLFRESFRESGEGVRLPRERADLRGSPGNFRGSPGNFWGSLENFRGTPGLL